jgi:hypothetical protein
MRVRYEGLTMKMRAMAVGMSMIIAMTGGSLGVWAQVGGAQATSIAVSLKGPRANLTAGEKPMVVVTIKIIGHRTVGLSTGSDLFRVHVEGKNGEPPETEWQRQRHGDYRPGDGPALMDGPVVSVEFAPGQMVSRSYDLTKFYDLSAPGRYSVWMEIRDPSGPVDGSGIWARTNTVQFEMEATAQ